MQKIIQLTTFTVADGGKQLANNKCSRCDSVIYCKTKAEAFCYNKMIEHFSKSRKGVDHLQGIIVICVDPSSTMIEGMHLVSKGIPNHIKSSYPFLLQAKLIGKENQAKYLEICGLKTEKELKEVWNRCANRLTFPIEASADEKTNYVSIFETANSIIENEYFAKRSNAIKDINKAENIIVNWLTNKFSNRVEFVNEYSWKKTWKVTHCINDKKTYAFSISMDFSKTTGIESFIVNFQGLGIFFSFPYSQDNNMTTVLNKFEMLSKKFNIIMEAISNTYNEVAINTTVS